MRTIKSFTEAAKGPRRALALCLALALLACLGRGTRAEMAPADTFAQEAQQLLLQMDGGQELSADLVVGYLASEAGEINPVHCNERDMVSLNQLVFESVVELDETQKPVPLLADSWSVEGNVWTFRMRQGVQFHNGMECLAQDVVASFEALRASESNPYAARLSMIESMTAVDAYTLQVTSRYAGMITLYAMTFPVMERSTISDLLPRGTGPYWYISYVPGVSVRLERNPLWWKQQPYIESVVGLCYYTTAEALEALQTGAIDALSTRSYSAAFNRRLSTVTATDYPTASYELLVPNLSASSPLSDVRVRRAVMYAIDRATLVSNAYLEMAQQSEVPIVPGTWLYESQSAIYYYSPERALQLLYEAGWTNLTSPAKLSRLGEDGLVEDLDIRIITYTDSVSSVRTTAAEQIAANLNAIGITTTVLSGTIDQVREAMGNGRYDLALMGVNLSEVPNLRPLLGADGAVNLSGASSAELDALLARTFTAVTEEEMRSAYSDVQMYVAENLPFLGLVFRTGSVLSTRSLAGLSGTREMDVYNGLEFVAQ
ncbi:MAG TPA: peptide ABC transporter substrate-binding protein [Candidatus Pullichristensenella stercoripullorum]|nr:peptide ABC transporter substrate-binding protein [Candidatus Pullichristensenella stercoripullorum]